MEIIDSEQAVGGLLFASLLVLVVFFIARRAGYFRLPPVGSRFPVTLLQTLGIFFTYLLLAFLVLPVINVGLIRLMNQNDVSKKWLGWAQIVSLFFVFICLLSYCFLIKSRARSFIFWGEGETGVRRISKSVLMGFMSWVISYPFVFLTGIVTSLISLAIWKEAKVEQVAVKQLKMTMGQPLLFSLMIFVVVLLIPFMEELLFRGFLQSLMKRYLGRMWSLLATALIFALVHYAPSQGTGNFQLISTLFVLSIFLGFIYERERTLWAPIALHSAFNGFSVILIIFSCQKGA